LIALTPVSLPVCVISDDEPTDRRDLAFAFAAMEQR
jgi:hypothetical protein